MDVVISHEDLVPVRDKDGVHLQLLDHRGQGVLGVGCRDGHAAGRVQPYPAKVDDDPLFFADLSHVLLAEFIGVAIDAVLSFPRPRNLWAPPSRVADQGTMSTAETLSFALVLPPPFPSFFSCFSSPWRVTSFPFSTAFTSLASFSPGVHPARARSGSGLAVAVELPEFRINLPRQIIRATGPRQPPPFQQASPRNYAKATENATSSDDDKSKTVLLFMISSFFSCARSHSQCFFQRGEQLPGPDAFQNHPFTAVEAGEFPQGAAELRDQAVRSVHAGSMDRGAR